MRLLLASLISPIKHQIHHSPEARGTNDFQASLHPSKNVLGTSLAHLSKQRHPSQQALLNHSLLIPPQQTEDCQLANDPSKQKLSNSLEPTATRSFFSARRRQPKQSKVSPAIARMNKTRSFFSFFLCSPSLTRASSSQIHRELFLVCSSTSPSKLGLGKRKTHLSCSPQASMIPRPRKGPH